MLKLKQKPITNNVNMRKCCIGESVGNNSKSFNLSNIGAVNL